jgi:hypothetical protein
LPPVEETARIRKELAQIEKTAHLLAARRKDAEAAVEMARERNEWTARMVRKGFVSPAQAQAEALKLEQTRVALTLLRKEIAEFAGVPRPTR